MRTFACFDIGGTNIKYGLIDEEGRISEKGSIPTPKIDCRNTVPVELINCIKDLKRKIKIDGVGISSAGLVDAEKGEIIFASDNLPGYSGARLADKILKETGLRATVENDVNSAAIGEMWKGAAADVEDFVCLTIGTGIGSAIVLNRKIYKGKNKIAGWLGHMIINENSIRCNCGGYGCYEKFASTAALIERYKSQILYEENLEKVDGCYILQKVRDNQKVAEEVFDEFIDHIVTGLVNITYILDPGLIIMGGGISEEGELFIDKIKNRFNQKCVKAYSDFTRIEKTKLGNDSGLFGACYLAICSQRK